MVKNAQKSFLVHRTKSSTTFYCYLKLILSSDYLFCLFHITAYKRNQRIIYQTYNPFYFFNCIYIIFLPDTILKSSSYAFFASESHATQSICTLHLDCLIQVNIALWLFSIYFKSVFNIFSIFLQKPLFFRQKIDFFCFAFPLSIKNTLQFIFSKFYQTFLQRNVICTFFIIMI